MEQSKEGKLEKEVKKGYLPIIGWLPLIIASTYYFTKDPSFGKTLVMAGAYLAAVSTYYARKK